MEGNSLDMKGKTYQYWLEERTGNMRIFRPDGISIDVDQKVLYFELERRLGISGATAIQINNDTLKMMYRVALELEQYVKFETV